MPFILGNNLLLYILCLGVPMLLGFWAQMRVKSAFARNSRIPTASRLTGAEVAQHILSASGIRDVRIIEANGFLGDHYNPTNHTLALSPDVYRQNSIAATGIAAHEVGHAIQHARAYGPLRLRMFIVPATTIASQALPFIVFGGFFFQIAGLIKLGVLCYAVLAFFQLITLPVEFDASRRANLVLADLGLVRPGPEAQGVRSVLSAAALTYVAAFTAALGNLIYLLLVLNNGRRS